MRWPDGQTGVRRAGLKPSTRLLSFLEGGHPNVVGMTTWVISIDMAADGPLGEQHDTVLSSVLPFLESLPRRAAGRAGNVLASELLSSTGIRETNRYLLLVDVDKPSPRSMRMLAEELTTVLPAGTNVSVLGEFDSVARASTSQLLAW